MKRLGYIHGFLEQTAQAENTERIGRQPLLARGVHPGTGASREVLGQSVPDRNIVGIKNLPQLVQQHMAPAQARQLHPDAKAPRVERDLPVLWLEAQCDLKTLWKMRRTCIDARTEEPDPTKTVPGWLDGHGFIAARDTGVDARQKEGAVYFQPMVVGGRLPVLTLGDEALDRLAALHLAL